MLACGHSMRMHDLQTALCFSTLRTSALHAACVSLTIVHVQDVDWTQPTAVIFGNELQGVTQAAIDAADQSVIIPMTGFAQSFNISVAASLVLFAAAQQRAQQHGRNGSVNLDQQEVLVALMMLRDLVRLWHATWSLRACTLLCLRHARRHCWADHPRLCSLRSDMHKHAAARRRFKAPPCCS